VHLVTWPVFRYQPGQGCPEPCHVDPDGDDIGHTLVQLRRNEQCAIGHGDSVRHRKRGPSRSTPGGDRGYRIQCKGGQLEQQLRRRAAV
jgi:hypothetical protein